jgi:S-adenosylmethionine synthetase
MRISEYVSVGHPDKVADYISEYILDWFLGYDPDVRYALEVQIKDNHVTLAGEITTNVQMPSNMEWRALVLAALGKIGYTNEYCKKWGKENTIDPMQLTVDVHIGAQSPDISQGVDNDGWGDQGIFWGMATRETRWGLPLDYSLAKELCRDLYEAANVDKAPWGLDIKTQVVLDDNNNLQKVIVAAPCREENYKELRRYVEIKVDQMPKDGEAQPEIIVNGTGAYIKHASVGDCGTTGRKLVVDFYGGNCRIGGGCPWTKDPTKADLSLNLYARKLAVDYLDTHKDVDTVYVSIGCCIGKSAIDVTIYDKQNNILESMTYVKKPKDVINELELKEPMYAEMCMYGLWG